MSIIGFVSVRVFAGVTMAGLFNRGFDAGARSALESALQEMQKKPDMEGLWKCCHPVLQTVGLEQAELRLLDENSDLTTTLRWTRANDEEDSLSETGDQWSANLKIYSQNSDIEGELVVFKTSRFGYRVNLTTEILDTLRLALGANLERLNTRPG